MIDYNRIITGMTAAQEPVQRAGTFKVDEKTQDNLGRFLHDVRHGLGNIIGDNAAAIQVGDAFHQLAYAWNRGATAKETVYAVFEGVIRRHEIETGARG